MASKQIGLGTVNAVDAAGGSSFTTVSLIIDATPPARRRVLVDRTALTDTLATNALGGEEHSEYVFTQYWHPEDDNHEIIDDLFDSSDIASWKITYPFGTPINDSFKGWVSDLEPETVSRDGIITRRVTIQRTTAITRA